MIRRNSTGKEQPLLINIAATAEKLSLSRRSVGRLITKGELKAVGGGRLRRILYSSILDYIERHRED